MAVYEKNTLLMCRDADGNKYLLYPITKLECVDGAEDLLHYGAAQDLTDGEKAQVLANIGSLPTPPTAQVGQFLRVAAVDANGRVTAVEAVDMPVGVGGSASVEDETLVLSGYVGMTVEDETLVIASGAAVDGENTFIT